MTPAYKLLMVSCMVKLKVVLLLPVVLSIVIDDELHGQATGTSCIVNKIAS